MTTSGVVLTGAVLFFFVGGCICTFLVGSRRVPSGLAKLVEALLSVWVTLLRVWVTLLRELVEALRELVAALMAALFMVVTWSQSGYVRSAHFLLVIAVRLLPPSERARYLEEFRAELLDVPRDTRLSHALSLLRGIFVVRLHRGPKKAADTAARKTKG